MYVWTMILIEIQYIYVLNYKFMYCMLYVYMSFSDKNDQHPLECNYNVCGRVHVHTVHMYVSLMSVCMVVHTYMYLQIINYM